MPRKNGQAQNASLEQLLEDVKLVVRDGQDLLKSSAMQLREKARVGAQSADRLVRRDPYRVLGVVFGLGFLAGLWASHSLGGRGSDSED